MKIKEIKLKKQSLKPINFNVVSNLVNTEVYYLFLTYNYIYFKKYINFRKISCLVTIFSIKTIKKLK